MGTKRLEIRISPDRKSFQITRQTRRGRGFGDGRNYFVSSDGFHLESRGCPQVMHGSRGCYVRGSTEREDNKLLAVPNEEWLQGLEQAVLEYNEKYGGTIYFGY